MRKKIVAGNWKMNKTPSEAVELVNMLKPLCAVQRICTMKKAVLTLVRFLLLC